MAVETIDQEEIFNELEWIRDKMEKYERISERMKQAADVCSKYERPDFIAKMIWCTLIVDSLRTTEAKILNWKGIVK